LAPGIEMRVKEMVSNKLYWLNETMFKLHVGDEARLQKILTGLGISSLMLRPREWRGELTGCAKSVIGSG
jgi:hypothetical protein